MIHIWILSNERRPNLHPLISASVHEISLAVSPYSINNRKLQLLFHCTL